MAIPTTQKPADLAEFARLQRENEELKQKLASAKKTLSIDLKELRVSTKGGVSVYGLGKRFPTTLYPTQWLELLKHAKEIEAFIAAHKAELSWKDQDDEA